MAVFKLVPHLEDDTETVDIQFTNNIFGSWTALVTNDLVAEYPKKFSDSRITDTTYIRFRVKNTEDEYSDWSAPMRPLVSVKPEPHRDLCHVYGRVLDPNTQEPLNSVRVRFRVTGGDPLDGTPDIRDKVEETDNYGWFSVPLTPGRIYDVSCAEASLKKTITVPESHNAKLSSL